MTEKKTLTQRISDVEFLLGRLVTKLDRYELESDTSKTDIFGDPKRAGYAWSAKEKLSFIKAYITFVEARAAFHKRSPDAILAFIEHNGLLREHNLRTKYEKLLEVEN